MIVDYHLHSTFSPDGRSSIDLYCEKAVALGIGEVCFTEHVELDPRDNAYQFLDPVRYGEEVERCRQKWADRLSIKMGVEFGYTPSKEGEIRRYLESHEFDFVLGSVHWVGVWHPLEDFFVGKTMKEAYSLYFEEVYRASSTGLFDVMAHLDFIKRYGFDVYGAFPFEMFRDQIHDILKVIIGKGMGIEINTSGLRNNVGELLPGIETLRLYKELGGKILTVGSDAHAAGALGFGLSEALDAARDAGFNEITVFSRRKPEWIPNERA